MNRTQLLKLRRIIRRGLEEQVDMNYLKKIVVFVPSQAKVIGVRVPKIRTSVKSFYQKNRQISLETVCQLLDMFFKANLREEVLFGIFLLTRFRNQFSTQMWNQVNDWVDLILDWEICDQLAMNIAGEIVQKDLSLIEDLIMWAGSNNKWRRRFAVSTTSVLNQKGRSHVSETLRVCEPLMLETKPIVQKAVGWALREASKKDEKTVYKFLENWNEKSPRRLINEASQKLSVKYQNKLVIL